MKIGKLSLSAVSIAVLVVQLVLVTSIAAKYLYQRWRCPRVWTRAFAYDPELPMRGRYLSLQLAVDGCRSTLPSAGQARFPRDVNGAATPGEFGIRSAAPVQFNATLKVEDNRLLAIRLPDQEDSFAGQQVTAQPGSGCDQMRLEQPADFFIADTAKSPLPVMEGQELWIEVTLPPQGPPRPLALALKDHGAWKPLALD
ncbi:MAG TPA: hypothetical protein VMD55_07380 [Terracidiphilus sp.]|nr:hypothetical protein [Terracidiphilus sp.]